MHAKMPSYDEFNALTLRFMGDGKVRHLSEIKDGVVGQAGLSPSVLDEKIPNGDSRAKYRVGWACSALSRAGLLYKPQRGNYQISPAGKAMLPTLGSSLGEKEFAQQPQWQSYLAERAERAERKGVKGEMAAPTPSRPIPSGPDAARSSQAEGPQAEYQADYQRDYESAATEAIEKLNDDLAIELLRRLREGSPSFFERAVIRVLRAMEYGGKESLAHMLSESHTGKAGDGGIDGIIKLDPLGVQNIYIQAKRYKAGNNVSSGDLQSFVGALHGKGVTRGVFITTSGFTPAAKKYAESVAQDRLVLIDGIQLTTFMLSYGVGVQTKQTLALLEIDEDFFE